MTILEKLRNFGISDNDIVNIFQAKSGGASTKGNQSYFFGDPNDPERFLAEMAFSKNGELKIIKVGGMLATSDLQKTFIENAISEVYGEYGYVMTNRILYSQKPLKGQFQWQETFRIKPCLDTSHIGKGMAWGVESSNFRNNAQHLGPPYPFILEVRTKKSSNSLIETERCLDALNFYTWTLQLLLPQLLATPTSGNGQLKWVALENEGRPAYHLVHEGFNAKDSEIETGENFTTAKIQFAPRYQDDNDYYNHLWVRKNEIEIPDNIEEYLQAIDYLKPDAKEDFRRSLYWFSTGLSLYNQEGLSVIPFTTAIECLLSEQAPQTCECCNRPISDGPTKKFKEFLESHLPLPNEITHLKKSIYPIRSSMVHGGYASAADNGFFSIKKLEESEFMVQNFVRRAIVNWLVSGKIE